MKNSYYLQAFIMLDADDEAGLLQLLYVDSVRSKTEGVESPLVNHRSLADWSIWKQLFLETRTDFKFVDYDRDVVSFRPEQHREPTNVLCGNASKVSIDLQRVLALLNDERGLPPLPYNNPDPKIEPLNV